ncbi:MAG: transposase [Polyangiaceae bacterium]
MGAKGVGPEVAATLLVIAVDNPERLHSDAALAALCGASPIEASSGRTVRHRLNRGENREGNNALWRIVLVRMSTCARTRAYVAKRTAEGRTKKEIIRCLQRYVAREIHSLLVNEHTVITGSDLRQRRQQQSLTLDDAARALNSWPIAISRLERGLTHNTDLATRYSHWLQHAA